MIRCVIIEDEPLALRGLIRLVGEYPGMTVLSVCESVEEFFEFQKRRKGVEVDLLFLDIELPGVSGITFLRGNQIKIPVVITTACQQYAIEAFELNVLDYLKKPISPDRFKQTIIKAESHIDIIKTKIGVKEEFIYIKSEKIVEKLYYNEITLIEAMGNYIVYHCESRKLICHNTLKNAEQNLPPEQFIKVQKSFIVNKKKIQKIDKGRVYVPGKYVPIARDIKKDIIARLTAL
jgi:DNA-binding LytR/AlgR family response regulator